MAHARTQGPIRLDEFGTRIMELLPRLLEEVVRRENNYLARGLITLPQMRVLNYLNHYGACQMHQLASALRLQRPSATGMVDRLVKHGLLERQRSEEDRRAVRVALTAKGKRILHQIYDQRRVGMMRLFGQLSSAERSQYLEILEKLVRQLAEPQTSALTKS